MSLLGSELGRTKGLLSFIFFSLIGTVGTHFNASLFALIWLRLLIPNTEMSK